ncbi:MAG: glycosyltransferase [Candidatus Hodarchaeota archaeon]
MSGRERTEVSDTRPVVSVIVPSYNSAQYIRQCLQSLRTQRTELPFEIILVDSSDDGTDLIVAREFPEVRMFHYQERHYVGSARNIGVEQATGEIVLFLDTDCIAPPTWVDQMYRAFQSAQADGVGGSIENGTPSSITGTVGFYLEFFRFLPYDNIPYTSLFLLGANCGFRKEVFENIRYYDLYDKTKIGEDFYFSWRLSQQGKKLVFAPSISVRHLNRTGLLKVMRYQYKIGLSACLYRYYVSPKTMHLFMKLPYLSFLLPVIIIPWIGSYVLRRLGIIEFLKFVIMLPLLYSGNYVWAIGFFRELLIKKSNANELGTAVRFLF